MESILRQEHRNSMGSGPDIRQLGAFAIPTPLKSGKVKANAFARKTLSNIFSNIEHPPPAFLNTTRSMTLPRAKRPTWISRPPSIVSRRITSPNPCVP
ncbi:hypothetical protein GJ744_003736 [Endocarpon pusillum]|uniref:Uncharacterized protein n=1 Tax=Endocarpon pusillum TaxID=364733 RepID=A0A8H7A8P5_9EURO|nr:hypothetical protein GJ744_003736 [Endocarpon pusillum]